MPSIKYNTINFIENYCQNNMVDKKLVNGNLV